MVRYEKSEVFLELQGHSVRFRAVHLAQSVRLRIFLRSNMIYVRSWDAHCPPLFSAQTIEEARSIVSRLGYTDVWYDINGEPGEAILLKTEIKELKKELETVTDQRDAARDDLGDCGHEDKIQELEQTVDEHRADLVQAREAIRQLDSHLDLMKAVVARAT